MPERRALTWKYEEGDGGSEADIGPAWVAGADGESDEVNGGEWLTRAEARIVAGEGGHDFLEDDGDLSFVEKNSQPAPGLDVGDINRKLRRRGVTEEQLRLSDTAIGNLRISGSLLHALPSLVRAPGSPYSTAALYLSPEKTFEALDVLIPGWNNAE